MFSSKSMGYSMAVEGFFMVGGWVKMSVTMVDQGQKIKKKNTGYNALEQSPKNRNLDQNVNDSKSHIFNSFFENIFSGVQP